MEYLTAAEISQKWNISSRMVAYYCKAGRIEGAMKKGKTWFLPVNAEKPVDKRFSKRKVHIKENRDLQGGKLNINKADIDNISTIMVRTVTFDETGYKGSGMCIVKPAAKNSQGGYQVFLEEGKCLYFYSLYHIK